MHGATFTARALSANVNRSTTRPQNTNPVSTHISIAVELTIITEDITSAGARMLNSSENVPATVLISPTYPYVETVAFIKHFFDHAGVGVAARAATALPFVSRGTSRSSAPWSKGIPAWVTNRAASS